MPDARALTEALGGRWYGRSGTAPCPVCQPERRHDQKALSITEKCGRLLFYCFKRRCSFKDIARAVDLPLGVARIDHVARVEVDRKRADFEVAQRARARSLWGRGKPIAGTMAAAYLRERGITCDLPASLRFAPNIFHAPTASWDCAMLPNVAPTGGVHRTFFDKSGKRMATCAKMMLGPCADGAVRLSDGPGPLVVCEGIETGLALLSGLLSGSATIWAALSTSGMKALRLPEGPHRLMIATDGDEAGRNAGNHLAARASALGWKVSLLPAPEGRDWADVLAARVNREGTV